MPVAAPIARTAFYCATLRADDAATASPVCGDTFAQRFIEPDVRHDLAPLLRMPGPAASNVARARIIDDLLRARLAKDPAQRVLLLGAGFDTRAYRLPGGRWFEVEDAELLAFKETRLPASEAPNPLTRLPITFATERLADRLAPLAGDDAIVVVLEGVVMYLPDPVLADLAATVRRLFPRGTLIADLQTPKFRRRYSGEIAKELARLGAVFADRTGHAARVIEAAGFRAGPPISIIDRAREFGTLRIPRWLLATFLRELRDGYAIWQFEPAP